MRSFKLLLLLAFLESCMGKRHWTYEIIDASGYSDDETKLSLNWRVERVGRHITGITGFVNFNYDVDNTTMIEVTIVRSVSGSERDFKPLPFGVPQKKFAEVKVMYDDLLYPIMQNCSNLPQIEGDLLWPWPRNIYIFDMCNFDNGNLPEILADGFYRAVFTFTGEVNWNTSYTVNLKTQLI
ncbi:uncharacterized protein LOC111599594 [Drosophila hydei]|uniref:Uncharacterized protein LOC111599594 n=1 Tax=Drosophila hydei TaxID=7224 RepID=A0A6J1LT35_DROHY|nr:uncharacterized protein LOC111599594 [Drosophila hydei]